MENKKPDKTIQFDDIIFNDDVFDSLGGFNKSSHRTFL